MNMRMVFGSVLALSLLAGLSARAQNAQNQPQGQVAANETKHVGDWLVRCFPVKSPTPCDMIYILAVKNTGQMMLSMRIAYAPSQDKQLLMIGVPLGVSFARGIVVATDNGATAPMPFQHCDRTGCYVSTVMENNSVEQIERSPADKTKVTFAAMSGKSFSLPFPLNGFAEAQQTMVQLAKGRASGASSK
jgi:invasion protein IalB